MAAHVVIYEPEAGRCCSGACSRIREIARDGLAPDCIEVSEIRRLDEAERGPVPDVVLLRAPARSPLMEALRSLRAVWKNVHVLAAVCEGRAPDLVDSLAAGLNDFFCCPVNEVDFLARLRRGISAHPRKSEGRSVAPNLDMLVGQSPTFLQAIGKIAPVAASKASVLIDGETGVGKELFARAVHYSGDRRSRPFIPINSSALPDQLFENELFGHAKGAYTDASTSEKGLLGEAEGGTVFLDEIDMLSASAQAKLLRFLQDREYRPLGSNKTLVADARIIAASNADLRSLVTQRRFREDLYYRLNILSIHVPPLRERTSDIALLAEHFLARFASQYRRDPIRLSNCAMRKLLGYAWPGNVRELEGLLHRAVVFAITDVLELDDIELPDAGMATESGALGRKDRAMDDFERRYLMDLLAEHHGNVSHAARAAGKDRRTMQRLLRKHSIERAAVSAI